MSPAASEVKLFETSSATHRPNGSWPVTEPSSAQASATMGSWASTNASATQPHWAPLMTSSALPTSLQGRRHAPAEQEAGQGVDRKGGPAYDGGQGGEHDQERHQAVAGSAQVGE